MPAVLLLLALALLAAPAASAATPRAATLTRGWEVRDEQAAPAPVQQPPPLEGQPEGQEAPGPTAQPETGPVTENWEPTRVPDVFDATAMAELYPGHVKVYRLRFRGPRVPPGWRWLIRFESVRRGATVYLNGRRLGYDADAYTPFAFEAKGLRPGRSNLLTVRVDNRKNPKLLEGWWNWGGIIRPVRLVPVPPLALTDLGWMSEVSCRGPARRCKASLLLDGILDNHTRQRVKPTLTVRMRAPGGRKIAERIELAAQRRGRRKLRLSVPVPTPRLWAPDHPNLYRAAVELHAPGLPESVQRRTIGLRSVTVKGGRLRLNNRPVNLRGASIHEDMPGHGTALTRADNARIVAELQAVGANVTRAHYLLNEDLLRRLDRAGIMVWSQAPVWQRDHRHNLLRTTPNRARARRTVRRTVKEARNHPSVITHSVANELAYQPDLRPGTGPFLDGAQEDARKLDPTLPVSIDIKGRAGYARQSIYSKFDMIGINQYYGWYQWVADFNALEPYLQEMRALYPEQALVMTEFGAEARPNQRTEPADRMGSWAFQAFHLNRTMDVLDRQPGYSGAIYWTLREFEIYPGWTGGPGYRRDPGAPPNTRHYKGLITYAGEPKHAFFAAQQRFAGVPLYAD
jgi:beta-glucuronidase